jgi:hypothetical protein
MVASAAPVIMLVAPGPMEDVCQMHRRLLIAHQDVGEFCLLQGLAHACHIAMSENSQHPGKKGVLPPITLDELVLQKSDDRLCRGQTPRTLHVMFSGLCTGQSALLLGTISKPADYFLSGSGNMKSRTKERSS